MSECSTCNQSTDTNVLQEDPIQQCQTTVHETVCVQGTVTIRPDVDSGPTTSFCIGRPFFRPCPGELEESCQFTVSQRICVQIPLTFKAEATAVTNGIVCGRPQPGPCPGDAVACTYSYGFFKRHSTLTNELITEAGGSILLGTGSGLSFEVTIDNAAAVLSLNTPTPPAPEDPPYAGQYQILYAQLLAAKLNVLRLEALGVEVCEYALDAIEAADEFLDDSPDGGMEDAPDYQEPLELFNTGNAPGCPEHCNEEE